VGWPAGAEGVDQEEEMRRQCTPENPYTPKRDREEPGDGWEHAQAYEVEERQDGYPGGDVVRIRCESCGIIWTEELPQ
jgi:hypothetical protein